LQKLFKQELGEFADKLWPSIKKLFVGFKSTITYQEYSKIIHQFVSMDHSKCKTMLMVLLDHNKDGQICEADLFESLKMTKSQLGDTLLKNDIQTISRFLAEERQRQGRNDNMGLKHEIILKNVKQAEEAKSVVIAKRPNEDVKRFLRDVVYFQKKNGTGRFPYEDEDDVSQGKNERDDLFGNQSVPANIKPFMDKEVNFKLYTDLLMEKTDLQRIFLDSQGLAKVQFQNFGIPEIVIRIFAFLAQEPPEQIALKKGR